MSSNFIYLQSKTFMLRIRVCTYTRNRQTRAWFGTHFSCFADHKEWKVAKTQKRTPIVPRSLCPFTTEYKWSNNPCSYIFHFNAVFIQGLGQLWLHLVPCAAGTSWCTTSEVCAKKLIPSIFTSLCTRKISPNRPWHAESVQQRGLWRFPLNQAVTAVNMVECQVWRYE